MDTGEARASLSVLLSVALADGELDLDEKRLLDVVAQHEYGDDEPPESRFSAARDVGRSLEALKAAEARSLTWKGALAIALVDGACTSAEHRLLVRIHEALVPDEPFPEIVIAEKKYGERFARVSEEIAEATTAFLRAVKPGASGAKMSQREYDALATELVRRKRDLYARALSIVPPPA